MTFPQPPQDTLGSPLSGRMALARLMLSRESPEVCVVGVAPQALGARGTRRARRQRLCRVLLAACSLPLGQMLAVFKERKPITYFFGIKCAYKREAVL